MRALELENNHLSEINILILNTGQFGRPLSVIIADDDDKGWQYWYKEQFSVSKCALLLKKS